jgi:hypothetical protein
MRRTIPATGQFNIGKTGVPALVICPGSHDGTPRSWAPQKGMRHLQRVAGIQGWFYLLTGIWPLVHGRSFQVVTGFKKDFWLAQTVGALLAVSGASLLVAVRSGRIVREIVVLAMGEALVLAVADITCVPLPGTTPVYWADAASEALFLVLWARGLRRHRPAEPHS